MLGYSMHVVYGSDLNQLMSPTDAMYSVFIGVASDYAADAFTETVKVRSGTHTYLLACSQDWSRVGE